MKKKEDQITVQEFLRAVNIMGSIKVDLIGIAMEVEAFTVQEFLRVVNIMGSIKVDPIGIAMKVEKAFTVQEFLQEI
jgi:hypothetical protein